MANNQIQNSCPIDWDDLFGRIGDEDIIIEFSHSFVKNAEKLIVSLKEAVDADNADEIELYAHALKGSASNIGAISLAKIAWQLEKTASEKDISQAGQWLEKIEAEFKPLKSFLQNPDWICQAKSAVE